MNREAQQANCRPNKAQKELHGWVEEASNDVLDIRPIPVSTEAHRATEHRHYLSGAIMRWPATLQQTPIEGELVEEEE